MFYNVIKKEGVLLLSQAKENAGWWKERNDRARDNTLTAMGFIITVDHLPAHNM
jgi:hypothetical protein